MNKKAKSSRKRMDNRNRRRTEVGAYTPTFVGPKGAQQLAMMPSNRKSIRREMARLRRMDG